MSEFCEIAESLVEATSSCPSTDVIAVLVSDGGSSSQAVVGVSPATYTGTAAATSTVYDEAFSLLSSAGVAASTVTTTVAVTTQLTSSGLARSRVQLTLNESVVSTGSAASSVVHDAPTLLLLSSAVAASAIVPGTYASVTLSSSGRATSSVQTGMGENALSVAAATTATFLQRIASETSVSSASAGSSVTASGVAQDVLLSNIANAGSTTFLNTEHHPFLVSGAEAADAVQYKNPDLVAWLMNTETTAASWYANFGFESIFQPPGKVLAIGPDGLYELTGDTDAGDEIDAEIVSGFHDFGDAQTKRVDNMYFGYTSDGTISVTAETYGSGHAPFTYLLEQRDAAAPRNSRVTPGKGLSGRYWRLSIKNVNGSDFEIHDATVDLAVSNRRV